MKQSLTLIAMLAATKLASASELGSLLSLELDELLNVPITASTLTEHDLRSVPSSVTVFTDTQIKRLSVDYLYELAELVPGFQTVRMGDSQHDYAISSRGRRIADLSAEILVLIDGQRIENPRTSSGLQYLNKLPVDFIEKIEFIRGPGAAIYGSNAMMGVINITTRSDVQTVSTTLGSNHKIKLTWQERFEIDKFKADFYIHYDKDQGQSYRVKDSFSEASINTKDPRDSLLAQIKVVDQSNKFDVLVSKDHYDDFYYFERVANDVNQFDKDLYRLNYQKVWSSGRWENIVNLSYNHAEGKSTSILLPENSFGSGSDDFIVRADFSSISYSLNWTTTIDLNEKSSLQSGIEYRHIDVEEGWASSNYQLSDVNDGIIPPTAYDSIIKNTLIQESSKQDIYGLFMQYQYQLRYDLSLLAGFRYDYFESSGDQLSPRLALVKLFGESHSLKLLYSEAFRAPTANETKLKNIPGLEANSDLVSERVKTVDLIWLISHNKSTYQIGAFTSYFDDSILQLAQVGGARKYVNKDQDPVQGLEFEAKLYINEKNQVAAAATYIHAKPEQSFREADELASLTWLNEVNESTDFSITANYRGARQMVSGEVIEPYYLLSSKINYAFSKNLDAYIQVKNLSDTSYQTPQAGEFPEAGIPNKGREISVGLSYSY
ncbi:TonB-dependent receptor plug domain-containing protein [Agaribacterium sp. ZY112]|uniref:TonB-dependent receptor plug domain-containing protein n=1 Tax=Agaribacterium sp. ZY112 TaxID=3233574 RepID=UPI003525B0FC